MESQELSTLFEQSISYDDIDKKYFIEKLDFNNRNIHEQLSITDCYNRSELFYYDKCNFKYTLKSTINELSIQPLSLKNGFGWGGGTGLNKKLLQSEDELIVGNCIYDLKVKGESIKSVEFKIVSEKEYSLPFDKVNDVWILKKFSKSQPLLLGCIAWCRFYLRIETYDDNERSIDYSYSVIICKDDMIKKIVCNSWTFDNLSYEHGFIKID